MLGLGGWFGGVIVAMVAFPALPLDDTTLAVLSIGVPVGLGIYLAWVDRNRSRRFGLAFSLAGALIGAWLGFQAGSGLLAVVTTIVGALAGANLTLLVLDIAQDRSAVEPSTSSQPVPMTR